MSYKLFIDDERDPIGNDWVIVRSYGEAMAAITDHGMPSFISFDHDLGEAPSGYDIVQSLVAAHQCGHIEFPDDFDFTVHSQNPIGAKNIEMYLRNYLKFIND